MKSFYEMTEEEILEGSTKAIHEYTSRLQPHAEFKLDQCVQGQLRYLNALIRVEHGLSYRDRLTGEIEKAWLATKAVFEPKFVKQARYWQQRYAKAEAVWNLNETMATALIEPAFKAAGLKAKVFPQRYRAQVYVYFGDRSLRFYVPFKELCREGLMDELIGAVKDLKEAAAKLGRDVKLAG